MTIAFFPVTPDLGAHIYTPLGPVDTVNGPFYERRIGEAVLGDGGSVFTYAKFTATAAQVVNQGDLIVLDNNFVALLATSTNGTLGKKVGTFFLGGRFGDPASAPFSYKFISAGDYGIWVQTDGVSLLNAASTALTLKVATTTATAGQADAPTAGPAGGTKTLGGVYLPATNYTFTADITSGSKVLKNLSTVVGIYPNQTLSATGIAGGQTIASIDGNPGSQTITLSANATVTGTTVTVTANGYVEAYLNASYISAAN